MLGVPIGERELGPFPDSETTPLGAFDLFMRVSVQGMCLTQKETWGLAII